MGNKSRQLLRVQDPQNCHADEPCRTNSAASLRSALCHPPKLYGLDKYTFECPAQREYLQRRFSVRNYGLKRSHGDTRSANPMRRHLDSVFRLRTLMAKPKFAFAHKQLRHGELKWTLRTLGTVFETEVSFFELEDNNFHRDSSPSTASASRHCSPTSLTTRKAQPFKNLDKALSTLRRGIRGPGKALVSA